MPPRAEPVLGVGDVVKITVYQNPDLTVEARVSGAGPDQLPADRRRDDRRPLGVAGAGADREALRDGGFVLRPQVTIQTTQIRSSQVSILGQVAKPGRFPIEIVGSKVSEMIAAAGGVVPGGADIVTLVGNRNGKPIKLDIDLPLDPAAGPRRPRRPGRERRHHLRRPGADVLHVRRGAAPGQLRVERGMTLMQALAQAGGLTARGTTRGIKVHRKDASGAVQVREIKMNDPVERDDVIYVSESLF